MRSGDDWKKVEEAVRNGAIYYARHDKDGRRTVKGLGRAAIRKRHPLRVRAKGRLIFGSKGDVDFSGDADGQAFYAEVKSARDVLKLSDLLKREHQIEKLRQTAARGCTSGFIFAWMPEWDCFWVPFVEMRDYFDRPWKKSIDRDMAMAWGKLLPVVTMPGGSHRVMFLDGMPHPNKNAAIARVELAKIQGRAQQSMIVEEKWDFSARPAIPATHPYEDDATPGDPFGLGDWSKPNPPKERPSLIGGPLDLRTAAKWAKRNGLGKKGWGE